MCVLVTLHPMFMNMLKQFSPFDARLLDTLFPVSKTFSFDFCIESNIYFVFSEEELKKDEYIRDLQCAYVVGLIHKTPIKFNAKAIDYSLGIFERFGLIEISDVTKEMIGSNISSENEVQTKKIVDAEYDYFIDYFTKNIDTDVTKLIGISHVLLTEYGETFLSICKR